MGVTLVTGPSHRLLHNENSEMRLNSSGDISIEFTIGDSISPGYQELISSVRAAEARRWRHV
jgi:hypothetical protein